MSEHLKRLQVLVFTKRPFRPQNNYGNVKAGAAMSNESMKRVLDNTRPDEPVFILCGRDVVAPGIIRAWAAEARARGTSDQKTDGAIAIAENMEQWQRDHPELVKVPD